MAEQGGPRINATMRKEIDAAVLCWLASVGADGAPSVTPKEMFAPYGDDCIVIGDIASSNSVRNILEHAMVCVSFVDVFRQKGFKLNGRAEIVGQDEARFAVLGADLLAMAGTAYPIRNIIAVKIEKVARIWAPSYGLFPDRSEDERMAEAYNTYGVRPLD